MSQIGFIQWALFQFTSIVHSLYSIIQYRLLLDVWKSSLVSKHAEVSCACLQSTLSLLGTSTFQEQMETERPLLKKMYLKQLIYPDKPNISLSMQGRGAGVHALILSSSCELHAVMNLWTTAVLRHANAEHMSCRIHLFFQAMICMPCTF